MRGKQARIMAWLLSVALLSGSLSMPAYAADAGTAPETTQTQTEENKAAESESDSKDKDKSAESGSEDQKSSDSTDSGESKKEESDAKEPSKEDSGSSESGSSGSASDAGSDGNSSDSGNQNDSSSESKQAETPDDAAGSGTDGKAAPADQSEGTGSDTGSNAGSDADADADADANTDANPASSDNQTAAPAAADGSSTLSVPVTDLLDAAQDPALLNESKAAGERIISNTVLTVGDNTADIDGTGTIYFKFNAPAGKEYEFLVYYGEGDSASAVDDIYLYDADWKRLASDTDYDGDSDLYICHRLEAQKDYYLGVSDNNPRRVHIIVSEYTAPGIIDQPANQTGVLYGTDVTFSAKGSTSGRELSYDWYESLDGEKWELFGDDWRLSADKTSSITVTAKANRYYRCVITDRRGNSITTETAKLTLSSDESDQDVLAGTITGFGSYRAKIGGKQRVYYKFTPSEGTYVISVSYDMLSSHSNSLEVVDSNWDHVGYAGTGDALTLEVSTGSTYRILFDNDGVSQNIVAFEINEPIPVEITKQPSPSEQSVMPGGSANLCVEAEGEKLTYNWECRYYSNQESGDEWTWEGMSWAQDTPDLEIEPVIEDMQVRCVLKDVTGRKVVSEPAEIKVTLPQNDETTALVLDTPNTINKGAFYTFTPSADGRYDFRIPQEYSGLYIYDKDGKPVRQNMNSSQFSVDLTEQTYTLVVWNIYNEDDTGTITISAHQDLKITQQPVDMTVPYGENVTFNVEYTGLARSIWAMTYNEAGDPIDDDWVGPESGDNGTITWTTTAKENKTVKFRFYGVDDESVDTEEVNLTVTYQEEDINVLKTGTYTVTPKKLYKFTPSEDGVYSLYCQKTFGEEGYMYARLMDSEKHMIDNGYGEEIGELVLAANLKADQTYYYIFECDGGDEENIAIELRQESAFKITKGPDDVTVKPGENAELSIEAEGIVRRYEWKCSTDGGTTWNYTLESGSNDSVDYKDLSFIPAKTMQVRCEITDYSGKRVDSEPATVTVNPALTETVAGNLFVGKNTITASADGKIYAFTPNSSDDYTFTANPGENGNLTLSLYKAYNDYELNETDSASTEGGSDMVMGNHYISKGSKAFLVAKSADENVEIPLTISAGYENPEEWSFSEQPQSITVAYGDRAEFSARIQNTESVPVKYEWAYHDAANSSWVSLSGNSNVSIEKNGEKLIINPVDSGKIIRCYAYVNYSEDDEYGTSYTEVESEIAVLDVTAPENASELQEGENTIQSSGEGDALYTFKPTENGMWWFDGSAWLADGTVYNSNWDIQGSSYGDYDFTAYLYKDRTYLVKLEASDDYKGQDNNLTIAKVKPIEITEQPESKTVPFDEDAAFHVTATGSGLSFELYEKNGSEWEWEDRNSTGEFTIYGVSEDKTYRIRIYDVAGNEKYSDEFTLTVDKASLEEISLGTEYSVTGHEKKKQYFFTPAETGTYLIQGEVTSANHIGGNIEVRNDKMMWLDSSNSPREEVYYLQGGTTYYITAEVYWSDRSNDKLSFTVTETEYVPLRIVTQPESQENVKAGESVLIVVKAEGTGLTYRLEQLSSDGETWNYVGENNDGQFTLNCVEDATYQVVVTDVTGASLVSNQFTVTVDQTDVRELQWDQKETFPANETRVYTFTLGEEDQPGELNASIHLTGGEHESDDVHAVLNIQGSHLDSSPEFSSYSEYKDVYNFEAGETYYIVVKPSINNYLEGDTIELILNTVAKEDIEITEHPQNTTVKVGGSAQMSVTAKGTGLSYSWYTKVNNGEWEYVSGGRECSSIDLSRVFAETKVQCQITDLYGNTITSDEAVITVNDSDVTKIKLGTTYKFDKDKPIYSFTATDNSAYVLLHSFNSNLEASSSSFSEEIYTSEGIYNGSLGVSYTPGPGATYPVKQYLKLDQGETYYIVFNPYFANVDDIASSGYSFVMNSYTGGVTPLRIVTQPEKSYYVREEESICVHPDLEGDVYEVKWYSRKGTDDPEEIGTSESGWWFNYDNVEDTTEYYYVASDPNGEIVESETFHIIRVDQDYVDQIGGQVMMNLFLTDKIGLRIHMAADQTKLEDDDFMRFELNGEVVPVYVKDAKPGTVEGKKVLTFEIPLATKQMTDEVQFRLVVNGVGGTVWKTSVKKYATELLNKQGTTDEVKDMLRAMLNYGGYAQKYFDYKADAETLANKELFTDDASDPVQTELSPDALTEYTKDVTFADDPKGIHLKSAALVLDTDVSIRFYYTLDDGCSIDDYRYDISGDAKEYGNEVDPETNRSYFIIRHISPVDLGKMYTLKVTDKYSDTTVATVKYGPLSYCKQVLETSSVREKTKELCRSIYYYYLAAENIPAE